MEDPVNKTNGFARIEFWAITSIFAFILFFFITDGIDGTSAFESSPYKRYFDETNVPFSFYRHYFIPQLIRYISLFLAFLYLNFIVIPKLLNKEHLLRNIAAVVLVVTVTGVIFGITDTYLRGYLYGSSRGRDAIDQMMFRDSFGYILILLFVLGVYTAIKYAGLYLLAMAEAIQSKYRFIRREGIAGIVVWMIALLLLIIGQAESEMIIGWMLTIPSGILLYLYAFYRLIPRSLNKKHPFISYVLKSIVVLIIAFAVTFLILTFFIDEDPAAGFSLFNCIFQLFITVPLTWALFKRHIKGNEEMFVLKKELGHSNANLDFLRSQINPHSGECRTNERGN
jgi:two-component system LytT family sensor kinase